MQEEQNFKNHVRIDPKLLSLMLLYVVSLVLIIAGQFWMLVLQFVGLIMLPILGIGTGMTARMYGFTVQDRIVRLEMQLRLAKVLDSPLRERVGELRLSQLIGLRFASDDELPSLVQQCLDGKLGSGKAIKQQVKHWQADFQRI